MFRGGGGEERDRSEWEKGKGEIFAAFFRIAKYYFWFEKAQNIFRSNSFSN